MQFDDRLATVLRSLPGGDAAARTQLRQLVDLLGSMSGSETGGLVDAAYARLDELCEQVPGAVQSKILREPGTRLRNPALVAHLAGGDPQAAAAALATARLDDSEWLRLIPSLPIVARGLLRHRRDLPPGARALLQRLGVGDLVLPRPSSEDIADTPPLAAAPSPPGNAAARDEDGIAGLVRRIEAFQKARRPGSGPVPAAPRLPLSGFAEPEQPVTATCDFRTDGNGTVVAASAPLAPLLVGLPLLGTAGGKDREPPVLRRLRDRRPLVDVAITLDGPEAIAGAWRLDAAPLFRPDGGAFAGYSGRLRRPPVQAASSALPAAQHPEAERMRQVLHELRTPVNAIQGFAEIIQQQLFAPVPSEYRALSAAIAVDAARLLGALEDVERLARLEGGAMQLPPGTADLRLIVAGQLRRLEGALRPRSAQIDLTVRGESFFVPLCADDAQLVVWRLLATLAGSLAAGETIRLQLVADETATRLEAELPLSLASDDDPFATIAPAQPRAINAGMFGSGFALRIARAEVEAVGGTLEMFDERLTLSLPIPMHDGTSHSEGDAAGSSSAA